MAPLINCWFIIESIVIPDGFLKWFYLSFYIHPLFLLFCQIFLWLKQLKIWIQRLLLLFVLKPTYFVVSCMFYLLRYFGVAYTTSSSYDPSSTSCNSAIVDTKKSSCQQNQIFSGPYGSLRFEFPRYGLEDDPVSSKRVNLDRNSHRNLTTARSDNDEKEDLNSHADHEGANWVSKSCDEYPSSSSSSLCSICSTLGRENDLQDKAEDHSCSFVEFLQVPSAVEEMKDDASNEIPPDDPFYNLYLQRMKWLDLLGCERTYGITAILKSELGFRNTFEGMDVSRSSPHKPLSKWSKKRILKSIENDVEMVYVAQSCLSWEALHHQYVKVQDFTLSSSNTSTFLPNNAADAFQKFQILLERFMENDGSCKQGTRYSNYVHNRRTLKSLLQVPQLAAVLEEKKIQGKKGEEDKDTQLQARKLLKAIENCIKTFWVFVKTDKKKIWYKFKTSRSAHARVEDPRDLPLLADLIKKLHKHEQRMKDLQGKKSCWLRMKRVASHTGEAQERRDILFTLIDLGLAKRALKMSVISSSQLRWCQQKLDNIHYNDGKVSRTITKNSPLFPPS